MGEYMILPKEIREKINELFIGLNKSTLVQKRENLTDKYKTNQAINKSIFESNVDSKVYAISRMPATFAVNYTLLQDLILQGLICDIKSIIDLGSGTGAGFFACKELFDNVSIDLFERDKNMVDIFDLFESGQKVSLFDIAKDCFQAKADLVMSSYVFSELNEEGRVQALRKMIDASNRFVLICDTGMPRTYENFMRLKKIIHDWGYSVVAPCESQKCGLKNDYCQFYARVERSSLLKLSKDAELSYEDEKYFYLLIDKLACASEINERKRVIRRPVIKTNFVELKLCTNNGVITENITKKNKEVYKKARKIKVNEIL